MRLIFSIMYLELSEDPLTSNGEDIATDETPPESINCIPCGAAVVVVVVVVVGLRIDPRNIPVAIPKGRAIRSSCLSSFSEVMFDICLFEVDG